MAQLNYSEQKTLFFVRFARSFFGFCQTINKSIVKFGVDCFREALWRGVLAVELCNRVLTQLDTKLELGEAS
jgi:hypothetical protein